jgi:hypothetical protein
MSSHERCALMSLTEIHYAFFPDLKFSSNLGNIVRTVLADVSLQGLSAFSIHIFQRRKKSLEKPHTKEYLFLKFLCDFQSLSSLVIVYKFTNVNLKDMTKDVPLPLNGSSISGGWVITSA